MKLYPYWMKPKERALKLLDRLTRDKVIYRDEYLELAMIACRRHSYRPHKTYESIELMTGFGLYTRKGWDIERHIWHGENFFMYMTYSLIGSRIVVDSHR